MGKLFLGVDPGKSGGLAVLGDNSLSVFNMPDDETGVWLLMKDIYRRGITNAMIEKVQGFIGHAQPGSAMFKFGHGYGGLRMALIGNGIAFSETAPVVWQRRLGIPPRNPKEKKDQYKKRLCVFCRQLFPKYVNRITLATCDAVLLAEYARRLHDGIIDTTIKVKK